MNREYVFALSFIIGLSLLAIYLVWLFTKGKRETIDHFSITPTVVNGSYTATVDVPLVDLQEIFSSVLNANNPVLGQSIDLKTNNLVTLTAGIQADTVKFTESLFVNNIKTGTDIVTSTSDLTITISNPLLIYAPYNVFILGNNNGWLPNQFTIKSVSVSENQTIITCMTPVPSVDSSGAPITVISVIPFAIAYALLNDSPNAHVEDNTSLAQQLASSASSLSSSFGGGYDGFAVSASYNTSSATQSDNTQAKSMYKLVIKQNIQQVNIDQTSPIFGSSINNMIFLDMLQTFMPANYLIKSNLTPLPATLPSYTNQAFISRFPFVVLPPVDNPNPSNNTLKGCWLQGDAYAIANGCQTLLPNAPQPSTSVFGNTVDRAAAKSAVTAIATSALCNFCEAGYTCLQSTKNPPPLPAGVTGPLWSGQCVLENTDLLTNVNLSEGVFNAQNIFYYNLEVDNQIVLLPYLNFSDGPFCMGDTDCTPGMFCSAFDATCKPNPTMYGNEKKDSDWWTAHNIMNPSPIGSPAPSWSETNNKNGSYPSELCYTTYPDQSTLTSTPMNCPFVNDPQLCCNSQGTEPNSFGFNSGYSFTNYTPIQTPFSPVGGQHGGPIGDDTIDASTWISPGDPVFPNLSQAPQPQFIKPTNNFSILRQALTALKNNINSKYGSAFISGYTSGCSITSLLTTSKTGTDLATQESTSWCVGASFGGQSSNSCQPGAAVIPRESITDALTDDIVATTLKPPASAPGNTSASTLVSNNSFVKPPQGHSPPPPEAYRSIESFIEKYTAATASVADAAEMMQCQLSQQSALSVSSSTCSSNSSSTDTTTNDTTNTVDVTAFGGPIGSDPGALPITTNNILPNSAQLGLWFGGLSLENAAKTALIFQPISTLLKSYINIMFSSDNPNSASNPMGRTEIASVVTNTVSVPPIPTTAAPPLATDFSFTLGSASLSWFAQGTKVSYVSAGVTANPGFNGPINQGTVIQLGSISSVSSEKTRNGGLWVTVTMNSSISATLQAETESVIVSFVSSNTFAANQAIQIDVWMTSLGSEYWYQLIQLYELSQISDTFCIDTMATYNSVDYNLNVTQNNFWVQKLLQDNSIDSALEPTSTSPGFASIKRRYICNVVNDSTCTVSTANNAVLNDGSYLGNIQDQSGAPGACLKMNWAGGWMAGGGGPEDTGVCVRGGEARYHHFKCYGQSDFSTSHGSNMIQLKTDPNLLLCQKGDHTVRTYTVPSISSGTVQLNTDTTNCYGSGSCGQPTGAGMSTVWDSENSYYCADNVAATPGSTTNNGPFATTTAPSTWYGNVPKDSIVSPIDSDVAEYCQTNQPSCLNPNPTYTYSPSSLYPNFKMSCGNGLSITQKEACFSDFCNATGDFVSGSTFATSIGSGPTNPPVCYGGAKGAPGLNTLLSNITCPGFSYTGLDENLSTTPSICNTTATNWCTDYPEKISTPYPVPNMNFNCPITPINSAAFCAQNPNVNIPTTTTTCAITSSNSDLFCQLNPGTFNSYSKSTCAITSSNSALFCQLNPGKFNSYSNSTCPQ